MENAGYDLMEHISNDLGAFGTVSKWTQKALGHSEGLEHAGELANAANAGINTGLAIDDFASEGAHSDKGYKHAGEAALNAAKFIPGAGKYVEGAELALDYGGKAAGWAFGKDAKFDAGDAAGGLLRNTMGDESSGWAAGSAVSDAVGGGALGTAAGLVAGVGVETMAMPFDTGKAILKGVGHEAGAIYEGLDSGKGAVGGAWQSMLGNDTHLVNDDMKEKMAETRAKMHEKQEQKAAGDKMVNDTKGNIAAMNAMVQMAVLQSKIDGIMHPKAAPAAPAAAPAAPHKPHKKPHRHH